MVDDSKTICYKIGEMIKEYDCLFESVQNIKQALQFIKSKKYTHIIIDGSIEKKHDGRILIDKIREENITSGAKIIVFSGDSEFVDQIKDKVCCAFEKDIKELNKLLDIFK